MNEMRAKIRENISAARMAADVKYLADLGPRYAGSEREWQAAQYIETQFGQVNGLSIQVDEVPGVNAWQHIDTRVRVIEPVVQELTGSAILGSGATPDEGVIGELLYVGMGRMEDYEKVDVKDKFVMRDPPRAMMLDNPADETAPQGPTEMLIKRGAIGFVEHSRLPGRIVQTDLLSGPKGLAVPAVAVTYEDGQYLKELYREWYAIPKGFKRKAEHQPVKLQVWVKAESKESHGINVIATLKGSERPHEKVLLVAHHDNPLGAGACDNATAVAVNLEAARALAKMGIPRRTIEFVSVTGEEYGEFGSFAYVNKYVKANPANYKGVMVLDIIGNGDHLYYITESICMGKLVKNSPWLNEYVEKVCDQLGYVIEGTQLEYASDDGPFILAGVPTTYLAKLISNSWPWLHTYMDDFSVVDINGLTVIAEICANTLWQLANE
ncbi:MAG: M20/M25/M40 family metallo-hydrolase [Anaerolineae bacterium]|nr:MAG: M20/M25/M40 family metallo-hydrolase [Anaerolineae bacterium]